MSPPGHSRLLGPHADPSALALTANLGVTLQKLEASARVPPSSFWWTGQFSSVGVGQNPGGVDIEAHTKPFSQYLQGRAESMTKMHTDSAAMETRPPVHELRPGRA